MCALILRQLSFDVFEFKANLTVLSVSTVITTGDTKQSSSIVVFFLISGLKELTYFSSDIALSMIRYGSRFLFL